MEAVSYISSSGDTLTVSPIASTEWVSADASEALSIAHPGIDREEYIAAMVDSVEQGLAFEVHTNDVRTGYMYNRVIDNTYVGVSINIKGACEMIVMFKTVFELYDAHKLVFGPTSDNIHNFTSLVSLDALRKWNATGRLSVLKSSVVPRGKRIFKYLGIRKVA